MATVTFDHVYKRFAGDVVAVNDLNLKVADGEFLVLVGPSGCGKTTALRCVAPHGFYWFLLTDGVEAGD
jgi:multiple sugar transport system ATP-binding protein